VSGPGLLRRSALAWHRAWASSATTARIYLEVVGGLRSVLPRRLRSRLLNNITWIDWPEVALRPRPVLMGRGTTVVVRPYSGPCVDLHALLSRRSSYEEPLVAWLETRVASYDTIIEIGANVGVFTTFFGVLLRQAGRGGRVYAFEPSRTAFGRLLTNVAANELDNVEPFNMAVAATTGPVDFFEPTGCLMNGSLRRDFASIFSPDVRKTTVAGLGAHDLATLIPIRGRTLLKIDAEGAESLVLDGLSRILAEHRPDIVLEVLPMYAGQLAETSVLRSGLYALHEITPAGPVVRPSLLPSEGRDWWLTAGDASPTAARG
jgi:FkbM family methyltransferase